MYNVEVVHFVASGYDWVCSKCGNEQHENAISEDWIEGIGSYLTCKTCGANYTLGDVSHVYE